MNLEDAIKATEPQAQGPMSLEDAIAETIPRAMPDNPDGITWGEAIGGLRPDRLAVSFGKNAWGVISSIPQLPSLLSAVAKETINYYGNKPPTAENYPLANAIIQDYLTRFGSEEGIKKTLRDDPASYLIELMPILAKAGAAGKLGKWSKAAENIGKYANPEALPGELLNLIPGRASPSYNPDMTATYGRDASGRPLTTQTPVADVAERVLGPGQGTSQGDVPAMILSDSGDTQIREGLQMHTPGDVEATARGRFDTSKEGIAEYQRQLVDVQGTSPGYDPFDAVGAGDQVITNFRNVQLGEGTRIKGIYADLENMGYMDTAVPQKTTRMPAYNQFGDLVGDDIVPAGWSSYFEDTMRTMIELKRTDSKLLPNVDYQKSVNILKEAIETAEIDGFSVRDFDRLRTNYRQRMDLAMRNGEISRTGSGTVATKMYAALTNDFYNLLDAVVPDPAFKQKVQLAKREYANIIARESTRVGQFLIKNQGNPRRLVDSMLKGDLIRNGNDIADLTALIGEQGIIDLTPALLSRLFDTGLRQGNWSPTGLRSAIAGVNSANKNKMRLLFGDSMARNLSELAEFSALFAREQRVKTNSPTGFINRVVGTSTWQSIGVRFAEMASIGYYGGLDLPKSAAMGVGFMFVNYFGSKGVERWMNSANGRRMMLEGGLEVGGHVLDEQTLRFIINKAKTATQITVGTERRRSRGLQELERRLAPNRSSTGVYRYAQ